MIFLILASFVRADTVFAEPKPTILEPRKILFSIKSADKEEISHVLSAANNVLKFYGPENVKNAYRSLLPWHQSASKE